MSQLANWKMVEKQHKAVLEFLHYLEDAYSLELDFRNASPGTPLSVSQLVDEYFDVNQAELDRERRELLEREVY